MPLCGLNQVLCHYAAPAGKYYSASGIKFHLLFLSRLGRDGRICLPYPLFTTADSLYRFADWSPSSSQSFVLPARLFSSCWDYSTVPLICQVYFFTFFEFFQTNFCSGASIPLIEYFPENILVLKIIFIFSKNLLTNPCRCSIIAPFGKSEHLVRVWRNWQTRKIQVLVGATSWRFKSFHPHNVLYHQMQYVFVFPVVFIEKTKRKILHFFLTKTENKSIIFHTRM